MKTLTLFGWSQTLESIELRAGGQGGGLRSAPHPLRLPRDAGGDAMSRKLWSLDVPDNPYPQHTSWLSRNLTQQPF